MLIDWNSFTPWMSLIGGLIIGSAALMLLIFNGRIAGISGIVGGLLKPTKGDIWWRVAFVIGLVISPLVFSMFAPVQQVHIEASVPVVILAGLLVGIGTRYGAGCTSGHGVCGLSRRSPRSVVATIAFMLSGFFTVFIVQHFLK